MTLRDIKLWKRIKTRHGNWVGICDELKLTVQSETYAELLEDIDTVIAAVGADEDKTDDNSPIATGRR